MRLGAEQPPTPELDPGAAGGIDLDSDLITDLAESSPNLAGVKLTYVLQIGHS